MASGAAKRYAQAVMQVAKEQNTLDAWQRDLDNLATATREPGVAQFLQSPNVEETDKLKYLEGALAQGQPEARNLAKMLLERNRLDIIPGMVDAFTEARMAEQGIIVADVTTAEPLNDVEQQTVRAQLEKMLGKQVELKLHSDPAIIGGIVARVGDRLIDGSVINQLRRLRARLATGAS